MPYVSGRVVHDADAHIMETPSWLRDHADPGLRDRIPTLSLASGNELRQTGDPEEQLADLEAAFTRLRAKHASDELPRGRGRGDHGPQELRRDRRVRPRGPLACARPSRVLEPARVQHLPQPPAPRLGALGRPRARARHRAGAQPRDGRVLRGRRASAADLLRAARRLRRRGARWPTRRSRWARPRCSSRPAARRATRRATSGSTRCGRGPRRRRSRSCSTSAAPASSSTRATSATACRSRRTSTAARRTSARSTTWGSPGRPRRRSRR